MKKPLRISMGLLPLLLSAVLAASLWMIGSELFEQQQEQNTFDQLTMLVMPTELEESVESVPAEQPTAEAVTDSTEPELADRNLTPLFEQNRDCIGWLCIPGTTLDYPVMHTPDVLLKYLRRDFFGNRNQSGVPFLDWRCTMSDDNLTGDVHALMIGAAGVGKTAYWLYPCIEYACASGMSWLSTDTKGDVVRNYGRIAQEKYGYSVSVIDLRNPTRSHGNNLLHLVNKYMDLYKEHPDELVYKAKAEKCAKIISKTIILSGMDAASFGQNAYFYDAAEGLLTATILLVAEFCEPSKRHIVSVFKIIQELLAPS